MTPVTFSAARRRLARKNKFYLRMCKLKPKERLSCGTYAILDGNFIKDSGEIDIVERWCRKAGVIRETERVVP
jgi:hypothetical protein